MAPNTRKTAGSKPSDSDFDDDPDGFQSAPRQEDTTRRLEAGDSTAAASTEDSTAQQALTTLQSLFSGMPRDSLVQLMSLVSNNSAASTDRTKEAVRLQNLVEDHLIDLLSDAKRYEWEEWTGAFDEAPPAFWTSVFGSVRPSPDLRPSLEEYPFSPLVDFRSRPSPPEAADSLKRHPKQQAIEETLKSLSDKLVRPLCRLALPGFDFASTALPDRLPQAHDMLQRMQSHTLLLSKYILMLHSDIIRRREEAVFTALGLKSFESMTAEPSLFSSEHYDHMKKIMNRRQEFAYIRGGLSRGRGRGGRKGRGRGRGWQDRAPDSTQPSASTSTAQQKEQSNSESAPPSRAASPAPKKSTSTPARGGRGKAK